MMCALIQIACDVIRGGELTQVMLRDTVKFALYC